MENEKLQNILERLERDRLEVNRVVGDMLKDSPEDRVVDEATINAFLGVEQGLVKAIEYVKAELGMVKINEEDLYLDLCDIYTIYDISVKKEI